MYLASWRKFLLAAYLRKTYACYFKHYTKRRQEKQWCYRFKVIIKLQKYINENNCLNSWRLLWTKLTVMELLPSNTCHSFIISLNKEDNFPSVEGPWSTRVCQFFTPSFRCRLHLRWIMGVSFNFISPFVRCFIKPSATFSTINYVLLS